MYNTQFKVKYNKIQKELLNKVDNRHTQEECNEDHIYSNEDVIDICNKLYRDELISVFGAENILDDKIDEGIKHVYDIMIKNEHFTEIINEMIDLISNEFIKHGEIISGKQDNIQLILFALFSQDLFYITHKCVCQQIELGTINDKLLIQLKKHLVNILKIALE